MDSIPSAIERRARARVSSHGGSRVATPGAAVALVILSFLAPLGGCRHSPPPPLPLAGGFATPHQLASEVLSAAVAGDRTRLMAMSLSETEFREHVWPHLPAARPERNLPFDYVWNDLHQKSMNSLDQTLARMRGEPLTLQSVTFTGEASDYGATTVQRASRLTVASPDGAVREIRIFGSMVTQGGTHKVFSYVVD